MYRLLSHVLTHLYQAHYRHLVALALPGCLNTLTYHFVMFVRAFHLVDEKDMTFLVGLSDKLHRGTLQATDDDKRCIEPAESFRAVHAALASLTCVTTAPTETVQNCSPYFPPFSSTASVYAPAPSAATVYSAPVVFSNSVPVTASAYTTTASARHDFTPVFVSNSFAVAAPVPVASFFSTVVSSVSVPVVTASSFFPVVPTASVPATSQFFPPPPPVTSVPQVTARNIEDIKLEANQEMRRGVEKDAATLAAGNGMFLGWSSSKYVVNGNGAARVEAPKSTGVVKTKSSALLRGTAYLDEHEIF